jgi:DNA-directed RNA polymerase specialized sigma24 family protein
MQALSSGDTDAMAEIYRRYESTLRTVILSVLHEEADVDDVLNDVFLQLGIVPIDLCRRRGFTDFS